MKKSNRLYALSRKCKVTKMPFAGRPPRPVRLYGERSRPSSGYKGGHKQGIILGGTDNQSFAFHPDARLIQILRSVTCRSPVIVEREGYTPKASRSMEIQSLLTTAGDVLLHHPARGKGEI